MIFRHVSRALIAVIAATLASTAFTQAYAGEENTTAVRSEDGKYFAANDSPTFKLDEAGKTDWYTYSGFRRYHSECHVCHGPDGEGSTYAPALKESAITLSYDDFIAAVASGIERVNASENQVMPSFASNPNVWCFVDDIYVYLKARGAEAIPRGRPKRGEQKPDTARAHEKECLG